MARVCFLDCIDTEEAQSIDAEIVKGLVLFHWRLDLLLMDEFRGIPFPVEAPVFLPGSRPSKPVSSAIGLERPEKFIV
jgi:hypothetical protein